MERLEEYVLLSGFLELLPHEADRPELELQFSQDMDPYSATDPANYRLVDSAGLDVEINGGSYDAETDRVMLFLNGGEPLGEGKHEVLYRGGQMQTATGEHIPGHLDLVVSVANPDPQRIPIRQGNGDGTFVTASTLEMPDTQPGFMRSGDLNGDGTLELIVGMPGRDQVRWFLGLDDGAFGESVTLAVGDTPLNVAIGDINLDGAPDLATANLSGSTTVLLNDYTGSFPTRIDVAMPNRTKDVAILPDGRVFVSIENVGVMVGSGLTEAGFTQTTVYQVSAGGGLAVGDVDGDGQTDVVVAAPGLPGRSVSVLYGNGLGFTPVTTSVYPDSPTKLVVDDVNADGRTDIVYIDPASNKLRVLDNRGNRQFVALPAVSTIQEPTDIQTGDVNEDGITEVIVSTTNDDQRPKLSLFFGGPDGLGPQQFESAGVFGSAQGVAVGEFVPLARLGSFVVLATPVPPGGDVILFEEHFDGPSLDTTRFGVNVNIPRGPASARQQGGQLELINRAHVYPLQQFDPLEVGPLRITGRWTFTSATLPAHDILAVLTRSDALPYGTYGETNNGVEAQINGAGQGAIQISLRVNGDATMLASMPLDGVDDTDSFDWEVNDDGRQFTFSAWKVGGDGTVYTIAAPCDVQFATNYVVFHNREANHGRNMVAYLDDVVISVIVDATSQPPQLQPIDDQTIEEDAEWSIEVMATHPDPDAVLTFGLPVDAPDGLDIDPFTGTLTWTPTEEQAPGTYTITVRVTDDGSPELTSAVTFSVSLAEVNEPPVLDALTDWTVTAENLVLADPKTRQAFEVETADAGTLERYGKNKFGGTPNE